MIADWGFELWDKHDFECLVCPPPSSPPPYQGICGVASLKCRPSALGDWLTSLTMGLDWPYAVDESRDLSEYYSLMNFPHVSPGLLESGSTVAAKCPSTIVIHCCNISLQLPLHHHITLQHSRRFILDVCFPTRLETLIKTAPAMDYSTGPEINYC